MRPLYSGQRGSAWLAGACVSGGCTGYPLIKDTLLSELKAQGCRIEALSKAEHDLIKEAHPQVGEIKESTQEVVDSVRKNAETAAQSKAQAKLDKEK